MFLDTSGLYCYLDAADSRHGDAVALLDSASRRLTHNYVLAEFVALCTARRIDRRTTLDFLDDLVADAEIEVVWITPEDHRGAMELLRARSDKTYSLCDAVSFQLMRRHKITEALTTDHHFEQEGFVRLLEP